MIKFKKRFVQRFKHDYFLTAEFSELHEVVRRSIDRQTQIDFAADPLVAACGADQWLLRGKYWTLVTRHRVIAFDDPKLRQYAFADILAVERTATGNVSLRSASGSSNLFPRLASPTTDLIDQMFPIVQAQWLHLRDPLQPAPKLVAAIPQNPKPQTSKVTPPLSVASDTNQRGPDAQPNRPLFWLGVLLLPIAFAWQTLQRGYTPLHRGIAFGWLACMVLFGNLLSHEQHQSTAGRASLSDARPDRLAELASEPSVSTCSRAMPVLAVRCPETAVRLGFQAGFEAKMQTACSSNTAPRYAAVDAGVIKLLGTGEFFTFKVQGQSIPEWFLREDGNLLAANGHASTLCRGMPYVGGFAAAQMRAGAPKRGDSVKTYEGVYNPQGGYLFDDCSEFEIRVASQYFGLVRFRGESDNALLTRGSKLLRIPAKLLGDIHTKAIMTCLRAIADYTYGEPLRPGPVDAQETAMHSPGAQPDSVRLAVDKQDGKDLGESSGAVLAEKAEQSRAADNARRAASFVFQGRAMEPLRQRAQAGDLVAVRRCGEVMRALQSEVVALIKTLPRTVQLAHYHRHVLGASGYLELCVSCLPNAMQQCDRASDALAAEL